jgi:hypothetical protein
VDKQQSIRDLLDQHAKDSNHIARLLVEKQQHLALFQRCKKAFDYMEDCGYSSFRHVRSEVYDVLRAEGLLP